MSGGGTKGGGRGYLQDFLVPRVITENCLRRGFAPVEERISYGNLDAAPRTDPNQKNGLCAFSSATVVSGP